MNYRVTQKKDFLSFSSSLLMNVGFLAPLFMTIWYTGENSDMTAWHLLLFLLFLAGATYREQWVFDKELARYKLTLFFIPVYRKKLPAETINSVNMKTFLRGEREFIEPGSHRKWFQTEQGVLKLKLENESEETLFMDNNRKNQRLIDWGIKIAEFYHIPFLLNK